MTTLEILETKIRNAIPELKEEWEVSQEGAIDRDMITQIGLNHVLYYFGVMIYSYSFDDLANNAIFLIRHEKGTAFPRWNLKYMYLKDQSEELINFLNELK